MTIVAPLEVVVVGKHEEFLAQIAYKVKSLDCPCVNGKSTTLPLLVSDQPVKS